MTGIIYIRVSSDKQVKGTSLEFQEEICRKYCEQNEIEVMELFCEEGESAKTADRTELIRAIEYCRKHKGSIQTFVVAKVDRFARYSEDHHYLRALLRSYGVMLHSVTEPISDEPTGRLLESVLAGVAEFDNGVRRQLSMDGMASRISQGIWPWMPPIGYTCGQANKRGEKKIAPDPTNDAVFPILQRGLREYAKGVIHSQMELARLLDDWGLKEARGRKTTSQFMDRMLGQYLKFYAGILVNPWNGEEHAGLHAPMISKEEFHRIQFIRSGKARVLPRDRHNPMFPLRRTVSCAPCSRSLTGSVSRGNGGRYPYYHCADKHCGMFGKTIRKDVLEDAFATKLGEVAVNEGVIETFRASVVDLAGNQDKAAQRAASISSKQLEELRARRQRIFEMREDGSYTKEAFQERLGDLDRQITQVKMSAEPTEEEDDFDAEDAVDAAIPFLRNPHRTWLDISPDLKPRFQKLAFPEGISYDRNRGFGTASLGLLYALNQQAHAQKSLAGSPAGFDWNQIVAQLKAFQELATLWKRESTEGKLAA